MCWTLCTAMGYAQTQTSVQEPKYPETLTDEPAVLHSLLERATELELDANRPDNLWQAAVLYCQAARGGSSEAQYRLGMLYAFGSGVPESRPLAAALFSLATSLGHAQASQMLDTIQISSTELPACVNLDQAPEKSQKTIHNASGNSSGVGAPIDAFLLALAPEKRWIIPLTTTLSAWYGLDPKLVLSVIAAESNFQADAQSPKAAMGLMQLIPGTAVRFNVRKAFDVSQNLRGGMAYLRWLLSYYRGDVSYTLAAYNAGEKRVDLYKGIPPYPETRAYVRRVTRLYGGLRHGFDASLAESPPWLTTKAR